MEQGRARAVHSDREKPASDIRIAFDWREASYSSVADAKVVAGFEDRRIARCSTRQCRRGLLNMKNDECG